MTPPNRIEGDEDSEVLLNRVVAFLKRFVVFTENSQVVAIALWVFHTHAFNAADSTPYLLITSPEKRSGKSRLLEILNLLVARGWHISGVSEAVLFRKIEKDGPTLLLDESDAIFSTHAEKTEPIRALINAGSRRNGKVSRCVGKNHDVKDFSVFCPKCLAGIENGRLPETIRDRSIPIQLHRKRNEIVEPFRYSKVKEETDHLSAEIASCASQNVERLRSWNPDLPEELNDRAAEGWEPLLAIAELAGEKWAHEAKAAAMALSSDSDIEDDSFGVQLLADLQRIWKLDDLGHTLFSSEICDRLQGLEDSPWKTWGRSRKSSGLNPRDLARFLRRYGIKPKTVRIGDVTRKGYQFDQFEDAWARYVPKSERDGDAEAGGDA
jgi:Protein of unknown function (DUF3631)